MSKPKIATTIGALGAAVAFGMAPPGAFAQSCPQELAQAQQALQHA